MLRRRWQAWYLCFCFKKNFPTIFFLFWLLFWKIVTKKIFFFEFLFSEAATGYFLQKSCSSQFRNIHRKHLCLSLFLIELQAFKKRLQHKYFPVNIAKSFRTILKSICERLLLFFLLIFILIFYFLETPNWKRWINPYLTIQNQFTWRSF